MKKVIIPIPIFRKIICVLLLVFVPGIHPISAQQAAIRVSPEMTDQVGIETHKSLYSQAYLEIVDMLDGKTPLSLKRAVFLPEWAYMNGNLDYDKYCSEISYISQTLKQFMKLNGLDKNPIGGNIALFEFFTNPNPLNGYKTYVYDFDDFSGKKDYSKLFVTKLMATHSGQCRSLPLFYKILSNEIGAESYIAYAPNHSFIRHKSEDGSRYMCVELTNYSMPREIFIIEKMGITPAAIQKGTYMKPCGDREIIINLLTDLASGYIRLYGWDKFAKRCYETALIHSPGNLHALMGKNNYLLVTGTLYLEQLKKNGLPRNMVEEIELEYFANLEAIDATGHMDMPPELYEDWVMSVREEIKNRNNKETINP